MYILNKVESCEKCFPVNGEHQKHCPITYEQAWVKPETTSKECNLCKYEEVSIGTPEALLDLQDKDKRRHQNGCPSRIHSEWQLGYSAGFGYWSNIPSIPFGLNKREPTTYVLGWKKGFAARPEFFAKETPVAMVAGTTGD